MTHLTSTRHPLAVRLLIAAAVVTTALLAAVWLTPRASAGAAAWLRDEPVLLHSLRAPGDGRLEVARPATRSAAAPSVLDAGRRFTMAGVVCDVPPAGAVDIRLRTSLDGAAWGPWFTAPLEIADEHGSVQAFTDPVWTGTARYLQIKAAGGSHAPAALTGVRIVAIETSGGDGTNGVADAIRGLASAVASIGSASPASAAPAQPLIVSRSAWGADERLRSGSPSYSPVRMAFVHHTASGNTYTQADAPAIVRAIYAYHTKTLGWSDIGYNFVIDRFGTVYEGRYGGMTSGVIGAHVYGFNTGSTGISVMGTFIDQAPPPEAVTALEDLLTWKLGLAGVDPSGVAPLTCGGTEKYMQGTTVTFPAISGHRQANYTECPGEAFYALLPAIRTDVAGRMASRQVIGSPSATPVTISPNGDGHRDQTTVSFTLDRLALVTATISLGEAAVRTIDLGQLDAGAHVFIWDGKDQAGSPVTSSRPVATLTATYEGGEDSVTRALVVDLYRPRLYVTAGRATRPRRTIRADVKIVDPFSKRVDLRYTIVDRRGHRVKSAHPGYMLTGRKLAVRWKPTQRGVFFIVYRATDLGANRQAKIARTKVVVR